MTLSDAPAAEDRRPVALILAGGRGTRFWPLSRAKQPKQLLCLEGDQSLLQDTVARLAPLIEPADVWVCTTLELAAAVADQLPEVPSAQILAEPEGRNTAPAIAWAIRSMPEEVRSRPVVVLPADHRIADGERFRQVLERAAREVILSERVLTLGVTPRWAETGYGYLELEADGKRRSEDSVSKVLRFTEKPDLATAESFLASGNYLWNAGIFVFRGSTLLELTARHLPALASGLEAIAEAPERLAELYPRLPRVSIDYGIMEQLDEIATLPLDCGWSDLGSWQALADILTPEPSGNTRHGDVWSHDASGNLFWAERGTIAALGVQDLIVVRTKDAVLVVPRERSQEVRVLVDQLEQARRSDLL